MPLLFLWSGTQWISGGKYALRGPVIGVGPEFETFLGPEMARAKRVPFGPKKVKNSGPTPITGPSNAYFPP